ncbi:ribosome biogenesis protein YTM1 [Leucosporidium creatinivorum]|uniref:Ribosome biogenesis protein YTM1 n=1 Tax=Leucosporidium creatinivorum TaxID=106004 RepID=A0A1Y2DL33_9BASI|nr:ribosome biogenesis protein YTM1 [Leucosporidium creatinivorum]
MSLTEEQPIPSTSAATEAPAGGEERQLAIRLTTKDSAYSIPSTKFLVPANWRRFHLSELINKVLENSSPIPFDFLINSSLLRSSLGAYCAQTGTSEEVTLEIEYLPSTLPPQLESTLPSEDWVSDVSLAIRGAVLTSSYAGTLSLHSSALPAPSNITFSGHDQSALSACYVPHPLGAEGKQWVASGGMDRLGRVWEYSTPSISLTNPTTELPVPTTLYTLNLHTAPISSVRSRTLPLTSTPTASPHLLTAGWDGIVGVWDLTPGVNEGEPQEDGSERKKKRRKQAPGTMKLTLPLFCSQTPVSVLRGHTGKVSRALFDRTDADKAYSAGWDHTVRSWDLSVASETNVKTSDKVLLSLAQMASPNLLATGSTDRLVSFWDFRESAQNISLTMPGHTGPVSTVAAHPTSPLLLASGSYDATVRIWDARSPKQALFVLPLPPKEGSEGKGQEKILAVDWDGERLVAGGEGARIVAWKVSGAQAEVPMVE